LGDACEGARDAVQPVIHDQVELVGRAWHKGSG
jgi:hypothetical protein